MLLRLVPEISPPDAFCDVVGVVVVVRVVVGIGDSRSWICFTITSLLVTLLCAYLLLLRRKLWTWPYVQLYPSSSFVSPDRMTQMKKKDITSADDLLFHVFKMISFICFTITYLVMIIGFASQSLLAATAEKTVGPLNSYKLLIDIWWFTFLFICFTHLEITLLVMLHTSAGDSLLWQCKKCPWFCTSLMS